MDTQNLAKLHKIASVQARTELSRSAIYNEIQKNKKDPAVGLKTVKIGRSIRVKEEDLQAFIAGLK